MGGIDICRRRQDKDGQIVHGTGPGVQVGGGGSRKGMQEGWNGSSRMDDVQATCPIGAKEHLGKRWGLSLTWKFIIADPTKTSARLLFFVVQHSRCSQVWSVCIKVEWWSN